MGKKEKTAKRKEKLAIQSYLDKKLARLAEEFDKKLTEGLLKHLDEFDKKSINQTKEFSKKLLAQQESFS